ncbi:MAG: Maf family nucleotide pyrophosphatase [Alphaproteobacteria bacterium]
MNRESLPPLLLASQSPARRRLLGAAGLRFDAVDSGLDEARMKRALQAEQPTPGDMARALAEMKAVKVSKTHPEALVVGADQVLACDAVLYDKPADLDQARQALKGLRGRDHVLVSAVAVAANGAAIWHHVDQATLRMRRLSDAALEDYMAAEGVGVLESVGAYRLEGLGAQLFERVDGDYFTVLGLPLLALLAYLRGHGYGLVG